MYLAEHEVTEQIAAVKTLSASLARESGIAERFVREIDAMKKLSGPHIVSAFDSGTDEDSEQMYFAMEFVDGPTLGEKIRDERRLPWDQAVDIALQICTALKAAHNAGIVHRDLKPSNLLVGSDGVVKLTDFGVAQVFAAQRLTVTGGIIGTAEYMSPEQANGQRCSKSSDLYSLGAVLYVMLTGRPPFTGKTSLDIIRQHLTANFDRPSLYAPEIPRQLEELVCNLLEKKPDDRHPTAHIVAMRLKEVVKRVELVAEEETEYGTFSDGGLLGATASAVPTKTDDTSQMLQAGPGSATMMRDVLVHEIQRQRELGPVGRFFDNFWVLLACLILLIAGGVWWLGGTGDGTAADSPSISPMAISGEGEVARFLQMAKTFHRTGDLAREESLLVALRTVLMENESEKSNVDSIEQRLEELKALRTAQTDDFALLSKSLDLAESRIASGETQQAAELLDGLLVLYGTERGAEKLIDRLRTLQSRVRSESSSATDAKD